MTHDSPAIFFHPDAIPAPGQGPVGRRVAGLGFLRAFLAHMPGQRLRAVTQTAQHRAQLLALADDLSTPRDIHVDVLEHSDDFTTAGAVFLPGPSFMTLDWLRLGRGMGRCSLIAVTHSMSTRRAHDSLRQLLIDPSAPWDALICTSHAIRSLVERHFDLHEQYLRQRFGAEAVPRPQLPVLPLGVEAAGFTPREGARAAQRAQYGVSLDGLVVLTVGRMAPVEKAHPVPMMQVLEALARRVRRPVHLWCAGWASRPEERALYEAAARQICPGVQVRFIDGGDPEARRDLWAGADIFTLPVDSIQESFGLAPLEAMAAGLPVVLPDWDGLRDTVVDGQTGFLVPTRLPRPGAGQDLALRFAQGADDYLQHLSLVQQQIAIDQPAYLRALERLAQDPDLRARMGAAGQARVRARYDWAGLMGRYFDLTQELAQRRAAAVTPAPAVGPWAMDPFDLYRAYGRHPLHDDVVLSADTAPSVADLDALDQLNGRVLYGRWAASNEVVAQVAKKILRHGPISLAALARRCGLTVAQLEGIVLFLAKFNLLWISDPQSPPPPSDAP